jgi:hypothetical protein
MKHCPRCGETKSLEMFGKDRTRAGGHTFYCRECIKRMQSPMPEVPYTGRPAEQLVDEWQAAMSKLELIAIMRECVDSGNDEAIREICECMEDAMYHKKRKEKRTA